MPLSVAPMLPNINKNDTKDRVPKIVFTYATSFLFQFFLFLSYEFKRVIYQKTAFLSMARIPARGRGKGGRKREFATTLSPPPVHGLAGVYTNLYNPWIPAFAGMTRESENGGLYETTSHTTRHRVNCACRIAINWVSKLMISARTI